MNNSDPSFALAPQDKLKVFISSTIGECAEERKHAAAGVRATNHEPILFEKLGARPYAPRDVYLSRLRQSQIVIAIYNKQYGYIDLDGGMDISGLEDEYRNARSFGLPLLIFVNKDNADRDPRLQALIDEVMSSDATVAFYEHPTDLNDLIKDSVTSLATQRFFDANALEEALQTGSAFDMERSAPPGGFIDRSFILNQIKQLAADHWLVQVNGIAGSGKTVLLNQLSKLPGYEAVSAANLSPKELFAVLTNKLRGASSASAQQFATFEGAKSAFASAWMEQGPIRLLLDDCAHIKAVIETIQEVGQPSKASRKTVIYTTRDGDNFGTFDQAVLNVPNLTIEEVTLILERSGQRELRVSPEHLLETTGGNALLVRQSLVSSGQSTQEIWGDLAPRVRELVSYMTLADSTLSVEELLELRGDTSYSVEQLFEDLHGIPEFVVETSSGFRIVHARVRDELFQIIASQPARLQFMTGRLGRALAKAGQIVRGYFVLTSANHKDAGMLVQRASFEAARSGDWNATIEIAADMLDRAERRVDNEGIVQALLSLAQSNEMTGQIQKAREYLQKAEEESRVSSETLQLYVEGVALSFELHHSLTAQSLSKVQGYRDKLLKAGQIWEAARISVDLSAAHINVHDAPAAEQNAREALKVFEEMGDEYGIDIAQQNLASALVSQPDKEAEADALIRSLERENQSNADGRRTRAWLCNVLVRKNRSAGHLEEAEARANEAIGIGKELGDEMLVAINSIGLGNVYSDMRKYDDAIAAYDYAASSAQKCARREVEAHATYLAADTYNELPEAHPLFAEAPTRAEHLARYAIGLMRGTIASDHMSRAFEALADALFAQNRVDEGVLALFEGSSFPFKTQNWELFERLFMTACHNVPQDDLQTYITGVSLAVESETSLSGDKNYVETMFELMSELCGILPRGVIIPFFGFHMRRMTRDLPDLVIRRLVDLVFDMLSETFQAHPAEPWRLLYPAIVLIAGYADQFSEFDYTRMSEAVARTIPDVHAKPENDGGVQWLVVLQLPAPLAVSIAPLDGSKSTILACFLLALFLKGFEEDMGGDLLRGVSVADEVAITVADIREAPEDLKPFIEGSLENRPCAVSRPVDVHSDDLSVPTAVFLADSFIAEIEVGEGKGGALQALLGLSVIEVAFRLMHGSIDIEALQPKAVKLVRQSIS